MSAAKPVKLTAPQTAVLALVRDNAAKGISTATDIRRTDSSGTRNIDGVLKALREKDLVQRDGPSTWAGYTIAPAGEALAAQVCPPPPSYEEIEASLCGLLAPVQERLNNACAEYVVKTEALRAVIDDPPTENVARDAFALWLSALTRRRTLAAERDALCDKRLAAANAAGKVYIP